ncbi:hypothetical protein U9M48_020805 [Paspalum notatum var. saurae]|uniref:Uncharacterized protein n=1 Tax=Paspalum notatum var. saurae TaxID=547442 RepID=A0AAQ3WT04_PASNO
MATTKVNTTTTLSMKLLIDSKAQRVLFAEASKDVVDFLFSLLVLPVGAAVKLLGKEAMVGSVGNLYASVEGLDCAYIQPGASKNALLRPAVLSSPSWSASLLRLPAPPSGQQLRSMYYRCTSIFNSSCRTYITDAYAKPCPTCGNQMTAAVQYLPPAGGQVAAAAAGFVQGVVTYTVMDNLTVMPMSAISSFTLLNAFEVTDLAALEEKTVQLGYNEVIRLLVLCLLLISPIILSHSFGFIMPCITSSPATATATAALSLSMKLFIDRKTQQVLFAEAGKEVVGFLFSLLALPFATAAKLLGKDAMVGCVANLFSSVDKLDSTYVLAGASKDSLLCPAVLSPTAGASSSVLRLPEPLSTLTLYRCNGTSYTNCRNYFTYVKSKACPACNYAMATEAKHVSSSSSSGSGQVGVAKGFVQGIVTYTVTDSLTVMPMSANSAISLLNFPVKDLFDLQEKTVQLGYNEVGLSAYHWTLRSYHQFIVFSQPPQNHQAQASLLIDRKAQRVLFAEASKEVVDFLFSLLALPVATAVKLVGKEAMVGCVGNLYASVDKLDSTYLLSPTVLSPAASAANTSVLRLPAPSYGQPKPWYRCTSSGYSNCRSYITDAHGKACPSCGPSMTTAAECLSSSSGSGGSSGQQVAAPSAAKGFVQGIVTYTVLDNLTVTPMSAISSITLLNTFAVRDIGDLQEKTVQLGYNEGLAILKASLQSKSVLTDVFLTAIERQGSNRMATAAAVPVLRLKLLVDTKSQRVLFAEAGKDAVDFLFSLLALPLATAVALIGASSVPGSVGSLYGQRREA